MKVKHLFFSMIAAAFLTSAISVDNTLKVGAKAPKIETIQGINVVNDANSEGLTTVVNFWSPKNPSSRIANRELSRKYNDSTDQKVRFISICTLSDDKLANEIVKLDGINPDNYFSYSQIAQRVFKDFDVENHPATFVIAPDGKILEMK